MDEVSRIVYEDHSKGIDCVYRDYLETVALRDALDYVFWRIKDEITSEFVLDLVRIVTKGVTGVDSFRRVQVSIMGVKHVPPISYEVTGLVDELLNSAFGGDDFLYGLAGFHLKFKQIHPFADGNGRVGRLLLNKIALAEGYPPFVIQKDDRGEYRDVLDSCDIEPLRGLVVTRMFDEIDRMHDFGMNTQKFRFCGR